jgi:hypothetical protein
MIPRFLSLVILISLSTPLCTAGASNDRAMQKHRSALSVLNMAGLPAQIIQASIESMIVSSWVEFEVYNSLPETVQELRLRVFKYSNSKLMGTADGVVTDPVPVGNHRYRILVEVALDQGTEAAVVLTKVRTNTGVWFIEPNVLNNETKVRVGATSKLQTAVIYEPNISLTADEKTQILDAVLNRLARDPDQAKLVSNSRGILVSRHDCSYAKQLSAAVPVEVLSLDEIQTIADRERRAVYIRCGGFDVEGSRVRVHLILNDRLARGSKPIVIPFHYNFEFVLLKNGNKWIVEKSGGYS